MMDFADEVHEGFQMKIDSNLPISPIEGAGSSSRAAAPAGKAAPAAIADTATLSSTAARMQREAAPANEVRTEKVAAVQQAIASGVYHVSTADVADKLIASMFKP
jgi:flagellar biosynthesis anti-sigma factor FlgM